ncbi:hypothetical protein FIBSPDRAFT_901958 [Athelia psychrophila]|uniref:Uncharacterized protein n=1 Tax=Athelia psychrophila TaxID=1759441 RepID=A0A165WE42_9AGAM|nr:hypothetical protein FIBSPDRAFT_901958 [Fibularhizoctonia sp. CBS 109695]
MLFTKNNDTAPRAHPTDLNTAVYMETDGNPDGLSARSVGPSVGYGGGGPARYARAREDRDGIDGANCDARCGVGRPRSERRGRSAVALRGARVATGMRVVQSSAPAAAPLAAERARCTGELRVGAGVRESCGGDVEGVNSTGVAASWSTCGGLVGYASVAPGGGLAARGGGSKGVRARKDSTMRRGGRTCGSSMGSGVRRGAVLKRATRE